MSYCIVAQRRAWWPVIFPGVTEDGDVIENRFELRFTILDEDEHLQIVQEGGDVGNSAKPDDKFSKLAAPFVERLASDWRGVLAENKEPLPFTAENILLLVKQPGVWPAIWRAYAACRRAAPEIREGN